MSGGKIRVRAKREAPDRVVERGVRSQAQRERLARSGADAEPGDDPRIAFEDDFADEVEDEWSDEDEMEDDEDEDEDEDGDVEEDEATRSMREALENGTLGPPEDPEMQDAAETTPWRPGVDKLGDGEVLDYDSSAYTMLHRMNTEWPSLSCDIVRDSLGWERTRFPMSMYAVAGTQAAERASNKIMVMKMSDLHKTKHDDGDSDSEDDNDDDLDDDPILEHKYISVDYCTNRVRVMPQQPTVAVWADTGDVHVYDVEAYLAALDKPGTRVRDAAPVHTFSGHPEEGFALDWSGTVAGRLLSGDCRKHIHLWNPQDGGVWSVDSTPYKGHSMSVEDLQWSPSEKDVFASCSMDKTIKIWDARKKQKAALSVQAHGTDVNVISWNAIVNYLMVSGADDGSFRIWDLRKFQSDKPVAHFKWHNGPITSVGWHPSDDSTLAVAGADDQVTIWDLSVEADDPDEKRLKDFPPQLLFLHLGQKDIKELRWHPQAPGVLLTTALDGFNVLKPSNL